MAALLKASFGGLPIFVATSSRAVGRTTVVHSPSQGDAHVVQDRGDEFGLMNLELAFCPVSGEADHFERYERFLDLKGAGAQVLIHPFHGSMRANVGKCLETIEGPDMIMLAVEFLPVGGIAAVTVSAVGAGIAAAGGVEAVTVAAQDLGAELAPIGVTSPVADDAVTVATGWSAAEEPDARQVLLELASAVSAIDALIDGEGLATDLALWPAFRSAMLLRDALRGAAAAATQQADQLVEVVVTAPIPLRMLCARVGGASRSDDLTEEVARLNDFGARMLVPAGTTLRFPAWVRG